MRMYDLILKKRDGQILTEEEIRWIIDEYMKDTIPDYQMSAMMMAIYYQGLNETETYQWTMAMAESGDALDLSDIPGIKVDKHSTGGVGDKTSLALAPIVASLGVSVAKMSGSGLGHTGGTIDKLHSIPGFETGLREAHFMKQVKEIGIAIMSQTADLAPADKRIYALRDVTATVDQMSLIASSIMSKKLAAGADAIVLDVKTGDGAFMTDMDQARKLATAMIDIGRKGGRNMTAVLTNMDQPLGYAIGNALEVKEAIDTLNGKGPEDFTQLVYTLGTYMLMAAQKVKTYEDGVAMIKESVDSKMAMDKFMQFVKAQGGDVDAIKNPEKLPKALYIEEVHANEGGYITEIDTKEMGICSLILGGGRETKESTIDPAVGLVLRKKVGDQVQSGDVLAEIHGNDKEKIETCKAHFIKHYHIGEGQPEIKPVVFDVLFS